MNRLSTSIVGLASLYLAFALGASCLFAQNQSSLVYPGPDGRLVYEGYANEGQRSPDNIMIDFSRAGYRGGGVAIPWVPVEITLDPGPGTGDDHARIQAAINELSARPLSLAGFRGTLLLRAGTYHVSRSLLISADGIVIRGQGQHNGGTVVRFTATKQSDLFEFFGSSGWSKINGTEAPITEAFVPSGVRSFNVASTKALSVGDRLMVHRTPNQEWIDRLGMGQYGWTPQSYRSQTPRVITSIDGNTVTVDAPLVHAIESEYGGGEVYRYHFNGALRNVGIERIRLESAFTSSTDEDHGWSAVKFRQVENGWARQVTARYFGYACIDIRSGSQFITVEDCAQLDPISVITGARRYSFNISDSSFILMQRCYTREGRHDYVTGSRTRGPNVFVDSLAENTRSDIGPHHRYAEGLLFDNVRGGPINVQNRRTSGTGHGWAGAQTVFWNCHATSIICDAPLGAMNFAIGCIGTQRQGVWPPHEPDGIWESRGVPVTPRSLYYAQLADRLGHQAVAIVTTPAQQAGTIWSSLSSWKGDSEAPDLPEFAPLQIDVGTDVSGEINSLQLNAVIRYPLPANFFRTQGWTQLSGPAPAVFENVASPSTSVTFPTPGVYEFQFAVSQDDNRDPATIVTHSGADTLVVTVTAPSFATVGPSSADRIVGRRQENAPALGYSTNAGSDVIGGSGSSLQLTRVDSDVVLGYDLPDLPAGTTLTGASFHFEIKTKRNESGADLGLDVYLLNTAAPEESEAPFFFFRGSSDPNPYVTRVNGVNLSEPQGAEIFYPDGTHVLSFTLEGDALALLQSLYGADGKPTQARAFFRFNLTHSVGSEDAIRLDRYRIDIGPAGSSLELFATLGNEPGNTFAAWIAGFDLDPAQRGPADDPDGDSISNAMENFFGTHPGEPTEGIAMVAVGEGTFSFTHSQNPSPADNLIAAYRWSTNLTDFFGHGETNAEGTSVAFASSTLNGLTTVDATLSGTPTNRLFVRITVTVD